MIISKSSSPTGPELSSNCTMQKNMRINVLYLCICGAISWPCVIVCFILQTITFTYAEMSWGDRRNRNFLEGLFAQPSISLHIAWWIPLFHSLSSFFQSRLLQQWAHQSVLKFSTKKGNLGQSYTSLSQWQKSRLFFPSIWP